MNIAPLNVAPLNAGSGVAITPAPEAPGRGLDAYFRWEARTPTGAFVSPLDSVYSWQARRNANEPEWCQFSYSMDAPGADALVYPNEVWQYRNDVLLRRYTIATQTRVDATARVVQIEGDGLMAQLGREMVTFLAEEDEDGEPIIRTVGQVIGLLLAAQNQTPKVRLGFVDSAIRNVQVVYGCEDKSILECLNELQRMTGGWFWVDTTRRLQFRRQRGFDAGNRVTLERNAQAIQQRTVYRDIVTRMIGIGKGASVSTATRVVVNDAAAQALYGVRVGYYTHKGISNEEALTKATTAALARVSGPRVTYDISALDISGDTVLDLTFDANLLTLGTRVNVVSGDIDLWTRVVGIHENGDSPIDVTLKFSNPAAGSPIGLPNDPTRAIEPDIIDAILDIETETDRLNRDTGVLDSVAQSIGVGSRESSLGNVAWWDPSEPAGNLPELMEDVLGSDDPDAVSYQSALANFVGEENAFTSYWNVLGVEDDYLEVGLYDPVTGVKGETIVGYVAKPYTLRVTPFDGNTVQYQDGQEIGYTYTNNYTRTATDTSTAASEQQVVTPNWFVGDIIRTMRGATPIVISDVRVNFEDMNTAGRMWAAVPVEE